MWALCKCTKNGEEINTDLIVECKLFAVKMNFSWSLEDIIFTMLWSGFPALQSLSVAFCLWCLSTFSFVLNKCKVAVLSLIPDDWEHWRHSYWRQVCFFAFRIFIKVNLPVWFGYYFSAELLHCSTTKGSYFGCIFHTIDRCHIEDINLKLEIIQKVLKCFICLESRRHPI